MPTKKKKDLLIPSIIFSSLLVSASLVFASVTISQSSGGFSKGEDFDKAVAEGIEKYVASKQAEAQQAEVDRVENMQAAAQGVRPVDSTDHIRGNKDADISIIEYSDFECPYCKRNHSVMQQVIDNFPGKVHWVYRHLPLEFHDPNATEQAQASECVAKVFGTESFWRLNDLIFERTNSNKSFSSAKLYALLSELEFNTPTFSQCMSSGETLGIITQHKDEAASLGVSGTPANIIRNNKTGEVKLLPGAYPYESFEATINDWSE